MKLDAVEQIVRATLYEGYMLYPYRPTSIKNQQRWNFGVLYPPAYSAAQRGSDAWRMQTECLLTADEDATIEVRIRFLRLMQRQTGTLAAASVERPAAAPANFQSLELFNSAHKVETWQEAGEQEVCVPVSRLHELTRAARRQTFSLPATRQVEPLGNGSGGQAAEALGAIVRTQEHLEGELTVSAKADGDLIKVTVEIANRTPLANAAARTRDEALLCSLVSAHTILGAEGAQFVSLLDPPAEFRSAAASCTNVGTWPVLVGAESRKDTMLSSPIILYDYPQIADESAGDLFDGTEIDEILTLRIMTLTEAEKREMRNADDRAKQILERTEMLPAEQLMKMHGAVRGLRRMKAGSARMKAEG